MFVCFCLLPKTWLLYSLPHMILILNQHCPASVLAYSFALTSLTHVMKQKNRKPCYKSRRKAEIETENK